MKVFVTNFAGHDHSDAQHWGEVTPIYEGYVRMDKPDRALFEAAQKIVGSDASDWLCPSGLLLLNILSALVWYEQHGQVQILAYDRKRSKQDNLDYREVVITKEQIQLILEHLRAA